MAHTDSCKIQVRQFVKRLVENGMSVNRACQETERESDGIPAETIRRWWKETQFETMKLVKNDQKESKTPTDQGPTEENLPIDTPEKFDSGRGGKREGAGRPPKPKLTVAQRQIAKNTRSKPSYVPNISNAMMYAHMAIKDLESIPMEDPERNEALIMVKNYIQNQLKKGG